MEPLGRIASRLMWVNRRDMLARIDTMHAGRPGRPLRARLGDPAVVEAMADVRDPVRVGRAGPGADGSRAARFVNMSTRFRRFTCGSAR